MAGRLVWPPGGRSGEGLAVLARFGAFLGALYRNLFLTFFCVLLRKLLRCLNVDDSSTGGRTRIGTEQKFVPVGARWEPPGPKMCA
jgi:hypothetical protein